MSLKELLKDGNDSNHPFWNETGGTSVSPSELFEYLSNRGYRKYSVSDKMSVPHLVKMHGNIVEQVTIEPIIAELGDYLLANHKRHIFDFILKSNYLTKQENYFLLKELEDNFLEDSRQRSYIPFRNIIIEISSDEISSIEYSNQDKLIWRSQIINHDISLKTEEEVNDNSVFKSFIEDITSHQQDRKNARFRHLCSLIGYLINNFKDRRQPRAVVLMDENLKGYPNGGTGKSLLANSISKIRETVQEDGKNFDASRSFAFQQVNPDTKILVLDDLKQNFDFEKVFPFISEGIQIERKYQDRYTIPFEKAPKLLITTNYAIQGIGDSFKRRLFEFELSSYYNEKDTPFKKYEHIFFDDWSDEEWDYFYSFMIYCCQFYFKYGIVESEPLNLQYRKARASLGEEITDFFIEYLTLGEVQDKNKLYHDVIGKIPEFRYKSQRTITNKLKQFCDLMGYHLREWHSGSQSLFALKIPD